MEISVDNLYVDIGLIGLSENFSCPLALCYIAVPVNYSINICYDLLQLHSLILIPLTL